MRDGSCLAPDGTLAGSDLNMAAAVRNARDMLNLRVEDALAMASTWPAAFLGLQRTGAFALGNRADLLVIDHDLTVITSWINGQRSKHKTTGS